MARAKKVKAITPTRNAPTTANDDPTYNHPNYRAGIRFSPVDYLTLDYNPEAGKVSINVKNLNTGAEKVGTVNLQEVE